MALVWMTDSLGGYLTSPELSRNMRLRAQPRMRFRPLSTPEVSFGMHQGDVLQYTKVGDADDGRVVAEDETVPTSNLTFSKDTVTAAEYTLGIDFSWRLDILAKLDVYNNIIKALTNSMARTLDKAAAAQFRSADLVYTPTGTASSPSYTLGTAGVALASATRRFNMWDHMNVVDLMTGTYQIPFYDDVGYASVGSTSFLRSFFEDGRWERVVTPENSGKFFRGEVGELYNCRFIRETNALDNALAASNGEAIYIGSDAVLEITIYPEEIQAKLGSDYGRDRGLRWVYYGAWKKTWDYSTDGVARMIRVHSLT
ncbi:MAG: hypothetical protein EOM25_04355 [Deltaproteobacteria bacterium]|nr:hypothetical protein [Deltaproteobacteria bacterium]